MKLLIGIATYKRKEKLLRCIQSIKNSSYKNFEIVIVADNYDKQTQTYLYETLGYSGFVCEVQPSQEFVIGAWNRIVQRYFFQCSFDGFIGLCDDVELYPESLEHAVKAHQEYFPDTDGIIGFRQECPGHPEYSFKWFGQTLMGRKFIERYATANYQICCPDYKHFYQDEEMYEYSSSLGKFKECESAILNHYHPGFIKTEMDETHTIIRKGPESPIKHDQTIRAMRKNSGYLWGRDFNLIGKLNECL